MFIIVIATYSLLNHERTVLMAAVTALLLVLIVPCCPVHWLYFDVFHVPAALNQ